MKLSLLEKYDKPTPRYTSYPTVPYWDIAPTQETWLGEVSRRISQNREISLYIHLPFCEQLCTYCGCNKRITVNHGVEIPYIESLLREWEIYVEQFPERPILKELHLGGGTPTFFSPENLDRLLRGICREVEIPEDHAFGFEAHPNNTTEGHLRVLRQNGFNRISIGVQDFSPVIMTAINRRQDEADIYNLTRRAREIGYESINYDFVYGLPFQRLQHIHYNLQKLEELMPDRVAYYSYAHVPWKQACQRRFTEADIPQGVDKRALYEVASEGLAELGYRGIGIDHFALPSDSLWKSAESGTLHRNFMGYTPYSTNVLIGLGASAISDGWNTFVQNAPKVEDYQNAVSQGIIPIYRGHMLTDDDIYLRHHILNLMCRFGTSWDKTEWDHHPQLSTALGRLRAMEHDHLVSLNGNSIRVLPNGLPFIRNIAQCFDARFWQNRPTEAVFSKSL
ncbi:oxygen-independent coproporphyrinogen III oxidase [Flavilitoribacter nigricans]|uniref:Coproporphyrinogen-III oxidase n=1 Tax=Flavilitoribacter nigricans (strain ATCC 23147 / DSM 23189 / NBRC 102662 / NCIMB 1420 / SS-2) TaxID=1122177 RepID=A0A2D0N5R3_FLAN2|nr:oxygen-independent coproporphyrinogen III oxidase [Flavilitoribacter nigricans]PHN03845.1 oxygen-independent coproporphyrinogen III oxidase [Flavilitoribacter nigricans DSM 23189 = NBRC 102662]